ncbi:MAG TPA: hypothetical protein VLI90_01880, partial [Tepidisphaeraceae bacterium]|nr:hypothetical protein [Tepidisphaeraceae bacterium]
MNVRSRSKTRAMKTPSGFVSASTNAKNSRIWSHPLAVMSEPLGPQERVHEVREQEHGNDDSRDEFERH